MKYNVGDKVRVREDLKEGVSYYMYGFSSNINCAVEKMIRFSGKIVTISVSSYDGYELKEDEEGFQWTDEMFDLEFKEEGEII